MFLVLSCTDPLSNNEKPTAITGTVVGKRENVRRPVEFELKRNRPYYKYWPGKKAPSGGHPVLGVVVELFVLSCCERLLP